MAIKFKFNYKCKVKSEIDYDYGIDPDDIHTDLAEIAEDVENHFNSEVDSNINEEFISKLNMYFEENDIPKIVALDVEIYDEYTIIEIYSNVQFTKEQLVDAIGIICDCDELSLSNAYFDFSASVSHPGWDSLSDYGYSETSEDRDGCEGSASYTIYGSEVIFEEGGNK